MATRKTVTVVFCDIVGSTTLGEQIDPEVHRRIQERYFDAARTTLERHGGTVEKFIGDAAMAVFGVPVAHDDDALRAVRAASDLRPAIAELNHELERDHAITLSIRTGVNTGEVVIGDPSQRQSFATGDAVATAQRLEAAARAGEILIGDATYRLVANAVLVEPVEPLNLKGKAQPVPAWRLLGVVEGAPPFPRRLDTPMVGRQAELDLLRAEFERAVEVRECRLATIVGSAGIGKSRLGNALFSALHGRATRLVGRCLAYGEGITYWPLRGIVLAAAGSLARPGIQEAVADASDGPQIAERLAGAVGTEEAVPGGEEAFWAVRRFLEHLAREQPLIVAIDELQWAEPTFLDLIEYLVGWTSDAPVLIVGLARPELLELRPTWPATSSLLVALEPLSSPESDRLVDVLGGAELPETERSRILDAAEGNPLFVEQMIALAAEGAPRESMPPSIHALLTARLDRLSADERSVLERAAVIGREFTAGAVGSLSGDEPAGSMLLSLVRRDLIEADRSSLIPGDDGFRFRHILIRDTAYLALPKETRASLHERYADWLEGLGVQPDEIVGYHLEQAFRYRQELGTADPALATRAGERLARAGRRAAARSDLSAAVALLTRAAALLPDSHQERREILPTLGTALMRTGDFTRAERILDEALESVRASGDRRLELRTLIDREFVKTFTHPAESIEEIVTVADAAIPLLEELGDDLGLAKAWWLKSEVHVNACRWGARAENVERALEHAKRAGDVGEQAALAALLSQALHYGPTPVADALSRCEELLTLVDDRTLKAGVQIEVAALRAMGRDFEEAGRLWEEARAVYEELGLHARRAGGSLVAAEIEFLKGNPGEAVSILRWGCETLNELGMLSLRSTIASFLADALCTIGEPAEARHFAEEAARDGAAEDIVTQVMWRVARSKADGREQLAEEANRLAQATDYPDLKARALLALGEDAEARRIYEAKGNVAAASQLLAQHTASS
jgi:class 3 adenylate cyclase/tetratricopeptide (TPR) repeat protein